MQLLVFHYKVALQLFSPLIVWMKKIHSIVKKSQFPRGHLKMSCFLQQNTKNPKDIQFNITEDNQQIFTSGTTTEAVALLLKKRL